MARQEERQIPVYLFTGFLDGGKTTFIQKTLEDARFNAGEKTLLLLCEEGEVEYDPASFAAGNVYLRVIEEMDEMTPDNLDALCRSVNAERVMVEYNGMWPLDALYAALPEDWILAQEMCFSEAATFPQYNANMRSLVYDKLKSCEVVIFNRCDGGMDVMPLHKLVRQANRRCNIAYEYKDGHSEADTTQDPLPFDKNAPVIAVEDRDYALFYSDLMENMADYQGKTVSFLSLCARDDTLPSGAMVGGRHVMTCCADDIQYAGMLCYWPEAATVGEGKWLRLTGKIAIEHARLYQGKGPVLRVAEAKEASQPEEPVATFY